MSLRLRDEARQEPARTLQLVIVQDPDRGEEGRREFARGAGQVIPEHHGFDAVPAQEVLEELGLDPIPCEIELLHLGIADSRSRVRCPCALAGGTRGATDGTNSERARHF